MARSRAFYRAQGKHTWIVTLVVALLVALILLALWLFYDLQRYIVYDKDTLRLVLPKDRTEPTELDASDEGPGATFTPVNVEIVVDPTDYSAVEAVAGEDLRAIHARFLASDSLTQTRLDGLSAGMGDFDSLVLELKPSLGLLRYESSLPLAVSYRVNGSLTLRETAEKLRPGRHDDGDPLRARRAEKQQRQRCIHAGRSGLARPLQRDRARLPFRPDGRAAGHGL